MSARPRQLLLQGSRAEQALVIRFTYVATWQGFVYVAFVIDAFARRIVGWRAGRTAHEGFVLDAPDTLDALDALDALDQAL